MTSRSDKHFSLRYREIVLDLAPVTTSVNVAFVRSTRVVNRRFATPFAFFATRK
jgi:hypothetical protein